MSGMRPLLAMMMVLLILSAAAPAAVRGQAGDQPIVRARREVELLSEGLVLMNDTFTLEAPSDSRVVVSAFGIGFQFPFIPIRPSFRLLVDGAWQPLEIGAARFEETFFYVELKLPASFALGWGVALRIRAEYLFTNLVDYAEGGFTATVPITPTIPYTTASLDFRMGFPRGAEIASVEPQGNYSRREERWFVEYNSTDLSPFQSVNAQVKYGISGVQSLLEFEAVRREININPGRLGLTDTYLVLNKGPVLTLLRLKIPADASGVRASDSVGPIEVEVRPLNDSVEVLVAPRAGLATGGRWGFNLEYTVPADGRVGEAEGGLALTYPAHGLPFYARRLTLAVRLPEGGGFVSSNPQPAAVRRASTASQEAVVEISGVAPFDRQSVVVVYAPSPVWPALRAFQWVAVAAAVVGPLYLIRRRRRPAVEAAVAPRRSRLEEFLGPYRERIALLAELEELERGLEVRGVSREHFDRRSAEIARRQRDLVGSLRRLGEELGEAEPGVGDRLAEAREAEADLERASADQRSLETTFRSRRLPRVEFQARRRELLKRRRRARLRLERVISALKVQ